MVLFDLCNFVEVIDLNDISASDTVCTSLNIYTTKAQNRNTIVNECRNNFTVTNFNNYTNN